MIIMKALVQQRKRLVLMLVKQRKKITWVFIATVIIAICLLTEEKASSLKLIIKMSAIQISKCSFMN